MKAQDLGEVYVSKLKDLYDAENQIVAVLPKMAKAASSADLEGAFQRHLELSKQQVKRLDRVFEMLGVSPGNRQCAGARGLLEECEDLMRENSQGAPLDAALIASAQSLSHYQMAGYGSVQTWARDLGQSAAADLLQETLEEETQADEELTEIAETVVNPEAGAVGAAEDEVEPKLE